MASTMIRAARTGAPSRTGPAGSGRGTAATACAPVGQPRQQRDCPRRLTSDSERDAPAHRLSPRMPPPRRGYDGSRSLQLDGPPARRHHRSEPIHGLLGPQTVASAAGEALSPAVFERNNRLGRYADPAHVGVVAVTTTPDCRRSRHDGSRDPPDADIREQVRAWCVKPGVLWASSRSNRRLRFRRPRRAAGGLAVQWATVFLKSIPTAEVVVDVDDLMLAIVARRLTWPSSALPRLRTMPSDPGNARS